VQKNLHEKIFGAKKVARQENFVQKNLVGAKKFVATLHEISSRANFAKNLHSFVQVLHFVQNVTRGEFLF
jgi:hypothetical protein